MAYDIEKEANELFKKIAGETPQGLFDSEDSLLWLPCTDDDDSSDLSNFKMPEDRLIEHFENLMPREKFAEHLTTIFQHGVWKGVEECMQHHFQRPLTDEEANFLKNLLKVKGDICTPIDSLKVALWGVNNIIALLKEIKALRLSFILLYSQLKELHGILEVNQTLACCMVAAWGICQYEKPFILDKFASYLEKIRDLYLMGIVTMPSQQDKHIEDLKKQTNPNWQDVLELLKATQENTAYLVQEEKAKKKKRQKLGKANQAKGVGDSGKITKEERDKALKKVHNCMLTHRYTQIMACRHVCKEMELPITADSLAKAYRGSMAKKSKRSSAN